MEREMFRGQESWNILHPWEMYMFKVKNNRKYQTVISKSGRGRPQKVVCYERLREVSYKRLDSDLNYWKLLVFWKRGRMWEVVGKERFECMQKITIKYTNLSTFSLDVKITQRFRLLYSWWSGRWLPSFYSLQSCCSSFCFLQLFCVLTTATPLQGQLQTGQFHKLLL